MVNVLLSIEVKTAISSLLEVGIYPKTM